MLNCTFHLLNAAGFYGGFLFRNKSKKAISKMRRLFFRFQKYLLDDIAQL